MISLPKTLLFRTATTLSLALLLLSFIFTASMAYFIMLPVGKRSADDLSALLVLATKTWVELPVDMRSNFLNELKSEYGIQLVDSDYALETKENLSIKPYLNLLKEALQTRLNLPQNITVGVDINDAQHVWINIPLENQYIRFGISVERIGARPPKAMMSMALAILVFALGTALILARRLTKPLEMLSKATTAIGRGEKSVIPEDNATEEVKMLAHQFNKMSRQVSELLKNRTTLLAGISHDLRTPLTRLRLALEINASSMDKTVQAQCEHNIEEMEQLLDQALQLARGVSHKEVSHTIDLVHLLTTLAAQLDAQYQLTKDCSNCRVLFEPEASIGSSLKIKVPEQSLLRILRNLLENALRYGNKQSVTIHLSQTSKHIYIRIIDQGLGIPADKLERVFQPFYRLEHSRNQQTGGSGLGLAIVKQLADANQWGIQLVSSPKGGTQALLSIPN